MIELIAIKPEVSFEEEKKEQELLSEISEILRKPYPERIKQELKFRKFALQLEELTITPYTSGKLPMTPYRLGKVIEGLPKLLREQFLNKHYQVREECYN